VNRLKGPSQCPLMLTSSHAKLSALRLKYTGITAEQLCWKSSRNWLSFDIPEFVFTNHHINDGEKFSHAGDDSNLLKFVPIDEPLIKSLEHRIGTNGREGRHVKLAAYLGAATPDVTSSTLLATITIERSHADQLRDLVPVKLAQLRTIGEQRHRGDKANAFDALEDLVFLLPDGGTRQLLFEFFIEFLNAFLEPFNMLFDIVTSVLW
jgi:hypothetical protein